MGLGTRFFVRHLHVNPVVPVFFRRERELELAVRVSYSRERAERRLDLFVSIARAHDLRDEVVVFSFRELLPRDFSDVERDGPAGRRLAQNIAVALRSALVHAGEIDMVDRPRDQAFPVYQVRLPRHRDARGVHGDKRLTDDFRLFGAHRRNREVRRRDVRTPFARARHDRHLCFAVFVRYDLAAAGHAARVA